MITQTTINKMYNDFFTEAYRSGKVNDTYGTIDSKYVFTAAINLLLPILQKQNEALKELKHAADYYDSWAKSHKWEKDGTGRVIDPEHFVWKDLVGARETLAWVDEEMKRWET